MQSCDPATCVPSQALRRTKGSGIINADGDLWRIQRKAGLRFFRNSNLKIFIDDVLPPLLQDTHEILDTAAASKTQVDLQAILLEMTTRFMGIIAYDVMTKRVLTLRSLPTYRWIFRPLYHSPGALIMRLEQLAIDSRTLSGV